MNGSPIILFFFDQLRADALGAAGNAFVKTPNLDRLAASSVRFESCITNAPLCRPARISLMTGLPVTEHGFDTNRRVPVPEAVDSHVRRMRDACGYHTVVVGKTHLHDGTGHLDAHRAVLERWGFSDAIELPDPQQHALASAHSDWLTATTPKQQIDKHVRWRDYAAHYRFDALPPDHSPWNLSTDDHLDSFCARAAADRIRNYDGERPLYLQVAFPGPHPPFDATSEHLRELRPEDSRLPLPIRSRGDESVIGRRFRQHRHRDWTEAEWRRLRVAYYGKVALVDRGVGVVLEALRETRLDERAWIIATADHGELLGDHGFVGKVLPYDGALRLPLIVRPPGGTTAWIDRGLVDLCDVTATIAAIAGAEAHGRGTPLHRRVLDGANGALAHTSKPVVFGAMGYRGVRTVDSTMTWDASSGRALDIFDRRRDPLELRSVVEELAVRSPFGSCSRSA